MGKVRKRIKNFSEVTEAALVFNRMGIIHHSCFYFHVRVHLNMSPEYKIVVYDTRTPLHINDLVGKNDKIPFANTFCTKS